MFAQLAVDQLQYPIMAPESTNSAGILGHKPIDLNPWTCRCSSAPLGEMSRLQHLPSQPPENSQGLLLQLADPFARQAYYLADLLVGAAMRCFTVQTEAQFQYLPLAIVQLFQQ